MIVRPFLRHLLRTEAFEVFIKCDEDSSSSDYSGNSSSVYAHSGHSTVPARSRFETRTLQTLHLVLRLVVLLLTTAMILTAVVEAMLTVRVSSSS
jgi:hypothetical protein